MTDQLRVAFASNMPAATVEVVSPDLEVVERFMLDGGHSHTLVVPSERSFLRVHLPSGKIVTLQDPGNLNREVSREDVLMGSSSGPRGGLLMGSSSGARGGLPGNAAHGPIPPTSLADADPSDAPSPSELSRYHRARSAAAPEAVGADGVLALAAQGTAQLIGPGDLAVPGQSVSHGREALWELQGAAQSYRLHIAEPSGRALKVQVPGNARRVWARADQFRERSTVSFSIRIQTSSDAADTIVGYLQRGDLYSAEAMAKWCDDARGMLRDKIEDPYAAVVGAYLLLRLRRFSQMQDWARNLANWFPFLPDGSVIWASQLMQQPSSDSTEIRKYLLESVQRGLPVYSEGLRLLNDGLRLMGEDGTEAREKVKAATGVVVWDSPVTASLHTTNTYSPSLAATGVVYDIAFAARA
ncbi:hypothetical protein [Bradyrhizobium liaoningense]|uniref:hypothetical protein n=1 Tax=Bradyrhizobium liaoningense TaxID=43992 RepID=UPI001BA6F4F3|nr:hypothetical protein [Bradyrhizobium liaoningense]MBR1068856.1 hypothetical protein [Bradyrhizobium liaoningense]